MNDTSTYQYISCLIINESPVLETIHLPFLDGKLYRGEMPYNIIDSYPFPYWQNYLEVEKN